MRYVTALPAIFVLGIAPAVAPTPAPAAPLVGPPASGAATLIEQVGYWRRYCRTYGCPPPVVVADPPAVDAPPPAAEAAPVLLPPPRPASCGEYHYWNGETCLDARYHDPYLGPRP